MLSPLSSDPIVDPQAGNDDIFPVLNQPCSNGTNDVPDCLKHVAGMLNSCSLRLFVEGVDLQK